MKPVRIGLLGCGNVGAEVARLLTEQRDAIRTRTGLDLRLDAVLARDWMKARSWSPDSKVRATDPSKVVDDPGIDVVVEVLGGLEPAFDLVKRALKNGKSVVTANKALLAAHGPALQGLSKETGAGLYYEAAVAGGVPLLKTLGHSLGAEPITRVAGIVNGTTNFILSSIAESGGSYEEVLRAAQELGYAEPDPTADVTGADAAAKLAKLSARNT